MVTAEIMTNFVGTITSFFTGVMGWVDTLLTTITSNPALLVLCVAMPIAGFAIGILGRILRA